MVDPKQPQVSVRRQCELLGVSRSGLYYAPEPTEPEQLSLMRRIDELHLKYPFYGSRKISDALRKEGCQTPPSWGQVLRFSPTSWGQPIARVMGPPPF